jgi:hypothetical protein
MVNRPSSMVNFLEACMLDKLNEIEKAALESLAEVTDPAALEAWRVTHLGRSSPLMGSLPGWGNSQRKSDQL